MSFSIPARSAGWEVELSSVDFKVVAPTFLNSGGDSMVMIGEEIVADVNFVSVASWTYMLSSPIKITIFLGFTLLTRRTKSYISCFNVLHIVHNNYLLEYQTLCNGQSCIFHTSDLLFFLSPFQSLLYTFDTSDTDCQNLKKKLQ